MLHQHYFKMFWLLRWLQTLDEYEVCDVALVVLSLGWMVVLWVEVLMLVRLEDKIRPLKTGSYAVASI